ncbi:5-methylthioadenosine/S-adenosylhomocysteine deaminase [Desulfovibrio sp. X2]|uniref:amidohydrolase family protein n=1 Tax=Desulfovibrio sp. X2 TaxID=941449 RepID=UPI0003589372|nr:amidohydrolase [Desulfovibrio sp. X2]EPR42346.1 5-methylthioadenosine/S-adenosylhomocysteine deaminase [Desulfovibrio sp. X2]
MDIPCELLVLADMIVTQDDERRVIENGAVAIHGDTITAVGRRDEIEPTACAERVLDLSGCLLMPGLVNAHCHAAMTLFRGFSEDRSFMDWLANVRTLEKRLTPHLVHVGALLSCAEMLAAGTTCFADMYLLSHEVARAAEIAGMRAVVAEGLLTPPTRTYESLEDAFALMEGLHARYDGHPLIHTAVMPHALYTADAEALRASRDLAEALDVPWMIHAAESAFETDFCLKNHGLRPIPYLDSLDLLTPRAMLVHCAQADEADVELLARRGAGVVHCPESNMKLGNGFAPVPRMLEAGITVALGTDGAASNNDLSLFREMGSAARTQKGNALDPAVLPAQTVLDMATRGGAACLRLPGVGRVEPGSLADLTALDLSSPNLMPLHDPVSLAVYAATGGEVRMTMVGGRVLYLAGQHLTLDMAELAEEAREAVEWAKSAQTC